MSHPYIRGDGRIFRGISKPSSSRKQRIETNNDKISFPVGDTLANLPSNYVSFLSEVLQMVQERRQIAIQKVNVEQLLLYWHLGKHIAMKQQHEGWGAKVIDRLSQDIKQSVSDVKRL